MSYTIRQATGEDEPFLWEMLYQALHVPPGQPPFPREIVEQPEIGRYLRGWGRDGDLALLAVETETQQPVGAVWIRLMIGEDKGYGYVDERTPELSIAVLPKHRGKGVGEQLMKQLFDFACARYAAVSLSVSADNPAANLYRRLGFETVSAIGNSLTMVKTLVRAGK